MQAWICSHGNIIEFKNIVQKHTHTPQLSILGILLSVASILSLRLGSMNMKVAFLLSGPIDTENSSDIPGILKLQKMFF